MKGVWILVAIAVLAGPAGAAAERRVPQSRQQIQLSYAPLVKKAAPAVVNIYAKRVVKTRKAVPLFDDPFFRHFFGEQFGRLGRPEERIEKSLGSGVIVRPDGLVVTNNHVIEGADQIKVVLADRREFEAEILGTDDRTDLALLRITNAEERFPALKLRDSDSVEVGDLVLAIGNPFGVGQTVTGGIVSAVARSAAGVSKVGSFIQTDAAINPGNSGGALIGMDGRLVGINTAIYSKSGGSMGIGFAIPSNLVRSVMAGMSEDGNVVRPWLGAAGQPVTADIAASLGMERPAGVLVNKIFPHGTAAKAGLKPGDVILRVEGHPIETPQDLQFRIATLPVGERAEVVVRRQGRRVTLTAPLVSAPEIPPRDETELDGRHPLAGAVVVNMSPAVAEEMDLQRFAPGVWILKVRRGSSADRLNFKPGDRLLTINGTEVTSVDQVRGLLHDNRSWRIEIDRGGKTLRLSVNR